MKTFSQFKYRPLLDPTANKLIEGGIELTKRCAAQKGKNDENYNSDNAKYLESLMQYCVKGTSYEWTDINMIKDPQVTGNRAFAERFAAVISQVITPVAPAVISERYMELAEVKQVGFGETGRFIVKSNDLFMVHDVAEGVQLGGIQRLYNDEITVNPSPKQIHFNMNFYHIASGIFDFGDWSMKVGVSFAGYIQKLIVNTFTGVITDLQAANSPYVAAGMSDPNFINISQKVQSANNNSEVYCMGTLSALGIAIPTQLGLQYGLGEEIAKVGHLDKYKGTKLLEIEQAMMPGTINTTATLMIPNNVLYFIAMGQYKPIKVVFEGENVTVETLPTQTVDKTMGLSITMRIGVASVVGSKFGAITF